MRPATTGETSKLGWTVVISAMVRDKPERPNMRNPVRRRRGTGPRPEDAPRPGCRSCRLVPMQRTPRPAPGPPPPPPLPHRLAPPRSRPAVTRQVAALRAPSRAGGGGGDGAAGRGEAPGAAVRGLRRRRSRSRDTRGRFRAFGSCGSVLPARRSPAEAGARLRRGARLCHHAAAP